MPKFSIIIPVFNEEKTLREIVSRVQRVSLEKELVIVDDGSKDGTASILRSFGSPNIKKAFHSINKGKGAAIRSGLRHAEGDIVIIQDADLEYNPEEYLKLIAPILEDRADIVLGSRFLGSRQCLFFSHYFGNKALNFIANALYGSHLSDIMTGYKIFRKEIFQNVCLEADRFGFEAEIISKALKRKMRICEVPISYKGRTYKEGKKIAWQDFFDALFWLIKVQLQNVPLDSSVMVRDALKQLGHLKKYTHYQYRLIEPFLGSRILEIGCGIGNMTQFFLEKGVVMAIDRSRENLALLRERLGAMEGLKSTECDINSFAFLKFSEYNFDTVVCINVLEHIEDDEAALRNIAQIMDDRARCIIFVPAKKKLFSAFDKIVGHLRRYDMLDLQEKIKRCGFEIERISYLNAFLAFGWWFNFCLLKRRGFSQLQLALVDKMVPSMGASDKLFKNFGLNILAVCRRSR